MSTELDRLVQIGSLKREPPAQSEIRGLVDSAVLRLRDARKPELSLASRFDLAYNAAHALALAALRTAGYRSQNRYLVFQTLPHTLGLPPAVWRVFAMCHQRRNSFEYEGYLEVDERLQAELVDCTEVLLKAGEPWSETRGETSS